MNEQSELAIVVRAKDQASPTIARIQKEVEAASHNFSNYMSNATAASQKFALGLGVVGAGAILLGKQSLGLAGNLESARQGFVTLLGSADKADSVIARVKKEAAATPFEIPGLISATQALAAVNKDGNKSIDILLNVGKALAAAGKGQVELDRIIANLQQIGLTGKITEMDVRQFGMAGINILELLGDHYGVTAAEAGEMVKDSEDAFGDLTKAFEKAGKSGGKFANAFADQAGTFNQLVSNMKDTVGIFLSDFVVSTGIFDQVKKAFAGLINFLDSNREKIFAGVGEFFEYIRENGEVIAGVITGALVPAFIRLAMSIGAMTLYLLPFMIAGAALVPLISSWVEAQGGLNAILDQARAYIEPYIPQLQALAVQFRDFVEPAVRRLADAITKDLSPSLLKLWHEVIEPMLPTLGVAFVFAIKLIIDVLAAVVKSTAWWIDKLSTAVSVIRNVAAAARDASEAIGGMVQKFNNPVSAALSLLPGRATGGPVSAGQPYVVGENRPEIFVPNTQGRIVPSTDGMGGGGVTNNLTGTFNFENAEASNAFWDRLDRTTRLGKMGIAA